MVTSAVPLYSPKLDRINRDAYQRRGALRQFGAASGWLEAGEHAAIGLVRHAVGGRPILDIGVGGGRTAPLMREISDDYCGIDYAPAMVALARRRFPDLPFVLMDARQLDFADDCFGLAIFSYNGIDSVDLAGQQAILREVHRVLLPGGYFVFSAMNYAAVTAEGEWPDWRVFDGAGGDPWLPVRGMVRLALGGFNRLRGAAVAYDDGEMAIGPLSACNFSLVSVFVSLAGQVRRLHAAGFDVETILTPADRQLSTDATDHDAAPWHHFVARKAAARA